MSIRKRPKDADLQRWRAAIGRGLPMLLSDIKSGKIQEGRRYHQLYKEYKAAAIVSFLDGDEQGARDDLARAVRAYILLQSLPDAATNRYVHYMDYLPMLLALILADRESATELARLYGRKAVTESDHPFHVNFGLAVKESILHGSDSGKAFLDRIDSQASSEATSFLEFSQTIWAGDEKKALKLLPSALDEYSRRAAREIRGTPDELVFWDGLGVIRIFELLHGHKLSISADPRLPEVFMCEQVVRAELDFE